MRAMASSHPDSAPAAGYGATLAGLIFLSFGLTLTLFGALYARDLETLRRTPEILWYALCGQPLPDASTGPILFGLGFAGVAAGALILLFRRRARPSPPRQR